MRENIFLPIYIKKIRVHYNYAALILNAGFQLQRMMEQKNNCKPIFLLTRNKMFNLFCFSLYYRLLSIVCYFSRCSFFSIVPLHINCIIYIYTVYPRLNAPGGVTFCKKSAKRLHITLSISAWKKNNLGPEGGCLY